MSVCCCSSSSVGTKLWDEEGITKRVGFADGVVVVVVVVVVVLDDEEGP